MAHRSDLNNHLKYWLSEMSNLTTWQVSVLKIPVSVTEGRVDSICPLAGFDLEAKKGYSRNWAVRFLFWKARWLRSTGRGTGKCDHGSPFSQRSLIPIETQLKTKRFKWESEKDNAWFESFENCIAVDIFHSETEEVKSEYVEPYESKRKESISWCSVFNN